MQSRIVIKRDTCWGQATCRFFILVIVVGAVEGEIVDDKVDSEVDDRVVEAVLVGGEVRLGVLSAIEMFKKG